MNLSRPLRNVTISLTILAVNLSCGKGSRDNNSGVSIDSGVLITKNSANTVPGVMWISNCSSTAVSTNTLITAAHCVHQYRTLDDGKIAGSISIHSGKHAGVRSKGLYMPVGYTRGDNLAMAYDVAVAVFPDGTFDSYFSIRPKDLKPRVGEETYLVGYSPENLQPGAESPKRWGQATISEFYSNITIVSTYGQSKSAVAVSPGDSGGPQFDGECRLLGVASRMSTGDTGRGKRSLHTNMTWQGNTEWLTSLSQRGAYICGLHGSDGRYCPASSVNRRDPAPLPDQFICKSGLPQPVPGIPPATDPQSNDGSGPNDNGSPYPDGNSGAGDAYQPPSGENPQGTDPYSGQGNPQNLNDGQMPGGDHQC